MLESISGSSVEATAMFKVPFLFIVIARELSIGGSLWIPYSRLQYREPNEALISLLRSICINWYFILPIPSSKQYFKIHCLTGRAIEYIINTLQHRAMLEKLGFLEDEGNGMCTMLIVGSE
jgi:hypothetical protein